MAVGAGIIATVVGARLLAWVFARPQRGLLLLAALVPFDGLLLLTDLPEVVGGWKEALVGLVALAAFFHRPGSPDDTRAVAGTVPAWAQYAIVLTVLGTASALVFTGGLAGLVGIKVTFFYLLIPILVWRCPLTPRDRDHLVTILMVTAAVTAVVGLAQQVVGDVYLVELGYTYNDTVRFAGNTLRSFSTFTQPFSFGLFLAMVLVIAGSVALADPSRTRNALFLASTPLLLAGMLTSVVRGAILFFAVGMFVLACWRYRGLLHALPLALIGLLMVPAGLLATFFSSSSLGQRATGWTDVLRVALSSPLGIGLGSTGSAAEKTGTLTGEESPLGPQGGDFYIPDNYYVKTLVELGPIGLWLLLLLFGSLLLFAVRTARTVDEPDRSLAQGISASIVGAGAASLVATYLEIFPLDFYFWLMAGVLLCLPRRSPSTHSRSDPAGAESRPTSGSSSGS